MWKTPASQKVVIATKPHPLSLPRASNLTRLLDKGSCCYFSGSQTESFAAGWRSGFAHLLGLVSMSQSAAFGTILHDEHAANKLATVNDGNNLDRLIKPRLGSELGILLVGCLPSPSCKRGSVSALLL